MISNIQLNNLMSQHVLIRHVVSAIINLVVVLLIVEFSK